MSETKKPGQVGHNGPPPEYKIDDGKRPYYERFYINFIGASEFGLSMSAVAVLRTLLLFANGNYEIKELADGTKLAPGQTMVGSKAVALRAGCDDKTVFAAYAELEAHGLMGRKSRHGLSSVLTVNWARLEQAGIAVLKEKRLAKAAAPLPKTGQPENGLTPPPENGSGGFTRKRVTNLSKENQGKETGVMGAPASRTARAAAPHDDPLSVREAGKPSSRFQGGGRARQATDDSEITQSTDDFYSEVPELNGNTVAWAERLAGISEEPIHVARSALHKCARHLRAGGVDPKTRQYVEPAPGDAIGGALAMGIEAIERRKGEPGSQYASVPASRLLAGFTRNIDVKAARARGTEPNHHPRRRGLFARRD
jgi:hypothetical protein